MKNKGNLWVCILVVCIVQIGTAQTKGTVYAVLQQRFNENSLAAFDTSAPVEEWIQTLGENGKWADLDYSDKSSSRWQPGTHWTRLLLLTQAYRSPGHSQFNQKSLKNKLLKSIAWWNTESLTSQNYWWNAIGVPLRMGETFLLLGDELPENDRLKGVASMKLGIKPDFYDYHGVATGQNLVWLATIHLMIGVLEKDATALKRAFGAVYEEIKITTEEGIQPDYSFHQHGPQLYSGGYGLGFTKNSAQLIRLAQDTPFAFPSEKITLFSDFVTEGQQWMIRGQTFDHSSVGREIARSSSSAATVELVKLTAQFKGPRQAERQTMALRIEGKAAPLAGNRHFWRSDFMAHHRAKYYSSVKMASNRILASESGNKENIRGYHLGQGVQLIYRTGNEYKNIFPVWDWRRLPGHLSEQTSEPLPLIDWGKTARGNTDFVGGVSDGIYGLAAYDYQRDNVRAKRAWFHFDDEIVCLGAAISCTGDSPLYQSINQCHGKSEVLASEESHSQILPKGQHSLPKVRWVLHDSVGYYFPENNSVQVRNDVQTGAWRDINDTPFYSDKSLNLNVFSIWIDLGKQARNKSYHYLVLPGISAESLKSYRNPVAVLRNDSTLQAVRHTQLNMIQAAYYQAGTLKIGNEMTLAVNQPVLLMVKTEPKSLALSLSNPRNKTLTVEVSVNGNYTCANCTWSAQDKMTRVSVLLPSGEMAGKSVNIQLMKR